MNNLLAWTWVLWDVTRGYRPPPPPKPPRPFGPPAPCRECGAWPPDYICFPKELLQIIQVNTLDNQFRDGLVSRGFNL